MIRPATANDATAICKIVNHIIADTLVTFAAIPKTSDDIRSDIARPNPYFVYEHRGVVSGYTCSFPFRAGVGYARVAEYAIALAPDAQRCGAGQDLLNTLITALRAQGITNLVGGVSGANAQGLAFHTAMGFAQVGLMPAIGHKWDQEIDLVFMQKRL